MPTDLDTIDVNALLAMPESAYMNTAQRRFFRALLDQQKTELLERARRAQAHLHDNTTWADPGDRALDESQRLLDARLRDREAKLRAKIDDALHRLQNGDYGWCEMTGEPIGLQRLLARPTATTIADVKTESEARERIAGRG